MRTIEYLKLKKDEIESIRKIDGSSRLFEIRFKNGTVERTEIDATESEIRNIGISISRPSGGGIDAEDELD